MSEEHLFQIWCLYLFYKASYDQKTDSMSFLEFMTSCTMHTYGSTNHKSKKISCSTCLTLMKVPPII